MKIRNATKIDIHQIYELGKSVHELDFSKKLHFHEKNELKEFISHKNENLFLVAEENKEILGFLFAKILSHHSGGWCMLDNIAINKKFRNKGIGTLLLKRFYTKLKSKKIHYIQILEEEHHKKTRTFWKSKGFKETKHFIWAEKII